MPRRLLRVGKIKEPLKSSWEQARAGTKEQENETIRQGSFIFTFLAPAMLTKAVHCPVLETLVTAEQGQGGRWPPEEETLRRLMCTFITYLVYLFALLLMTQDKTSHSCAKSNRKQL